MTCKCEVFVTFDKKQTNLVPNVDLAEQILCIFMYITCNSWTVVQNKAYAQFEEFCVQILVRFKGF